VEQVTVWLHGVMSFQGFDLQLDDWWRANLQNLSKQGQRVKAAILMYVAWNIRKERNRTESRTMTATSFEKSSLKLGLGSRPVGALSLVSFNASFALFQFEFLLFFM
jgi:hypothetical protein